MPTLTFPLSRIEGHAQVVIEVQRGEIISAHFQATEFRGFEHFVHGIPAEQMVVIVPRICGVCSTAHHVAAVKALEDAFDVTPPPLALKMRELLLLGQLIQNQATSLFIFTLPDRLGSSSILQRDNDSISNADLAKISKHALEVRKAGTDLLKSVGGQFIHPVKAVIGGMTGGVTEKEVDSTRSQIERVLPLAHDLFEQYWEMSVALSERIGSWGDDSAAYYLAAVSDTRPDYTGGPLRIINSEGVQQEIFHARDFHSYFTFEETHYSYANKTSFQGELLRANSLARINMTSQMGTPQADHYLQRFRETFGRPAHAIMLFDLARGIELVYSLERALEILSEPLDNDETEVGYGVKDGEAYGLVEAPRGPLIHHYTIENGLIAHAEFIIPTVFNIGAIERALHHAANQYISADGIDMELENAVGRVVRAFDPCIACATH
jgi:coenzyme F420-reducing hydrogenase alpha subunit